MAIFSSILCLLFRVLITRIGFRYTFSQNFRKEPQAITWVILEGPYTAVFGVETEESSVMRIVGKTEL